VPHLHWHVIPRYRDDRHFPAPVWASADREGVPHEAPPVDQLSLAITTQLTALRATP